MARLTARAPRSRSGSPPSSGATRSPAAHPASPERPPVTLRSAHADFSWVVVVANAAVGLWALAAHYDARFRRRALWRATLVAELTIFVQVALGVALVALADLIGRAALRESGGQYVERISDWSSDVCSADLLELRGRRRLIRQVLSDRR